MTVITPENRTYFLPGDLVIVGLHLAEKTFAEDSATVISHDEDEMRLELCGNGFPSHLSTPPGTRAVVTRWEGRHIFICNAVLMTPATGKDMRLNLMERMLISERREYSRADVSIRLSYSVPASQEMGIIMQEWEEMKNCPSDCLKVESVPCRENCTGIPPHNVLTRVNLSGSGLRFKIRDCLAYGTLLHLRIAIPENSHDHIHAVGSIIRTRELLPVMEQNAYFSTSMAFKVIDSHDRKRLLEYLLKEQRRAIL